MGNKRAERSMQEANIFRLAIESAAKHLWNKQYHTASNSLRKHFDVPYVPEPAAPDELEIVQTTLGRHRESLLAKCLCGKWTAGENQPATHQAHVAEMIVEALHA